ncbi:hypothetical protein FIBSPDRAFT_876071 [Athelia psychrophila]|uniref:Uncharacterized protein n=1 Tax=Athelia psychrophila TaxID=1759441 RepID=A0A167X6E6_9AGAM|nr:hypothetical protein FIBSPDRAFT_876071 [Fibularhizoctonia sp. CBS 109695]
MQCIVRHAEDLPVTSLEIMTLAYTVMTVAMYIVWWNKPLNVSCVVRVPVEDVRDSGASGYHSIGERITMYVIGAQDDYVDLDDVFPADMIALFVAMVFGAVHCMAWNSEFQTHLELQLWRSSAIAIIIVPVALAVGAIVPEMIKQCVNLDAGLILGALYTPIAIIYVAARLILIILSFTSLSALPAGAYQTIQWTTFIPHI